MELKVNYVRVCSGMCSELDSQKVDNTVKFSLRKQLPHIGRLSNPPSLKAARCEAAVFASYMKLKRERSLRLVSEILIAISLHGTESQNIVCGYYVRVLCIVCLCIILCDARKDSENLTFILKQSYSLERLCY